MWLERYLAGEHEAVWHELVALGPQVREAPHAQEAAAVAREMMRRARLNLQTIVDRLTTAGYPMQGRLRGAPPMQWAALDIVEHRLGMLPLALRAWWEHIDQVDLGDNSRFRDQFPMSDGLVIGSPLPPPRSDMVLLSGDLATRYNGSGPHYTIQMPVKGADVRVEGLPYGRLTFVEYLRLSLSWGGFPGFSRYGKTSELPPASAVPHDLIAVLTADLLPL